MLPPPLPVGVFLIEPQAVLTGDVQPPVLRAAEDVAALGGGRLKKSVVGVGELARAGERQILILPYTGQRDNTVVLVCGFKALFRDEAQTSVLKGCMVHCWFLLIQKFTPPLVHGQGAVYVRRDAYSSHQFYQEFIDRLGAFTLSVQFVPPVQQALSDKPVFGGVELEDYLRFPFKHLKQLLSSTIVQKKRSCFKCANGSM